ncbi:MAG: hypothetical protein OXH76_06425, partial [Boseongicola sp.]|nr:hypothetical protein [Boseongicola sp.]
GLSLGIDARTLLAHESDGLGGWGMSVGLEWDPRPDTRRGPTISMRQAYGGPSSGGLDALFLPDPLEGRVGGIDGSRASFEAAYGLSVFGGRFTGTPHAGCGFSGEAHDCNVGWRLTPETRSAPDVSIGAKATRSESGAGDPESVFGIELNARW